MHATFLFPIIVWIISAHTHTQGHAHTKSTAKPAQNKNGQAFTVLSPEHWLILPGPQKVNKLINLLVVHCILLLNIICPVYWLSVEEMFKEYGLGGLSNQETSHTLHQISAAPDSNLWSFGLQIWLKDETHTPTRPRGSWDPVPNGMV